MSWNSVVKFFHIISVILFGGGLFARQLVRRSVKKTDDIHLFTILSQTAGQIETSLVIPGSIAALILGVILALIGDYPIFGFLQGASQNWLLVSNVLLIGTIALVPAV